MRQDYRNRAPKRGGFLIGDFDVSKFLKSIPQMKNDLVDLVKPYTSALAGPIITALTGIPVPSLQDTPARDKLAELGKKAFSEILNKGLSSVKAKPVKKTGKGFKKL